MSIITKEIGRVSIVPKGVWNSNNTYTKLDLVSNNGSSYIAKQDVPINININNENYWKLIAEKGDTGASINNIRKTGTSIDGLTDTYTVYLTNGETTTFQVKNGIGITSITGPSTSGQIDTYTINFEDGRSTTFTIQNAKSIESITEVDVTYTPGEKDKYRINYNDGTYFDFEIQNGEDGQGLVSTVDNIRATDQDVSLLIFGDAAPTTNTVGKLKQRYYDRINKILYICTDIDTTEAQPTYIWQSAGVSVDNELNQTSENPVQNKVISSAINELNINKQIKINANGILKADGNGNVSAATAGEDYSIPSQIPVAANTIPLMDGTASAGSESTFSRSDHVHPEDSNLRNAINNILLETTGDLTDRTEEIVSRLQNYKKCILGTGTFYTTGINMPNDAALFGSGDSTILRKTGSNSYIINMNKNNMIENLCIDGNDTISSTISTHHGILWNGNYSSSQDSSSQPKNGKLSNLTIKNCNGGGITCNDTGYGRDNNIIAENITITNCNTGINIPFFSEYHRFTNIDIFECYYGCINNGGNNSFVNCDFSNSKTTCFTIDNSNDDKLNHAHGSAIGCFFNHPNENSGGSLVLNNIKYGYVFDGCQFFGGYINITDCKGIIVSNSVFGNDVPITITRGGGIVFADSTFGTDPVVTITNNDYAIFNECLNRNTGEYIPQTGQTVLVSNHNWNFSCVSGIMSNQQVTLHIPTTAQTSATKDIGASSIIATLFTSDGTILANNQEVVSSLRYLQLYSAGRGMILALKDTTWPTTRTLVGGSIKLITTEPIK